MISTRRLLALGVPLALAGVSGAGSSTAQAATVCTPTVVNSYACVGNDVTLSDTGPGFGSYVSTASTIWLCDASGCQRVVLNRAGAGVDVTTNPLDVAVCFQLPGSGDPDCF